MTLPAHVAQVYSLACRRLSPEQPWPPVPAMRAMVGGTFGPSKALPWHRILFTEYTMHTEIARMVDEYDRGVLTRRELIGRLTALGALLTGGGFSAAQTTKPATAPEAPVAPAEPLQLKALDFQHVALNVADVARSTEFYIKHLGMRLWQAGGDMSSFLTMPGGGWLALYKGEPVGYHHCCYIIENYNPDRAIEAFNTAGIKTDRRGNRVYVRDPDRVL